MNGVVLGARARGRLSEIVRRAVIGFPPAARVFWKIARNSVIGLTLVTGFVGSGLFAMLFAGLIVCVSDKFWIAHSNLADHAAHPQKEMRAGLLIWYSICIYCLLCCHIAIGRWWGRAFPPAKPSQS